MMNKKNLLSGFVISLFFLFIFPSYAGKPIKYSMTVTYTIKNQSDLQNPFYVFQYGPEVNDYLKETETTKKITIDDKTGAIALIAYKDKDTAIKHQFESCLFTFSFNIQDYKNPSIKFTKKFSKTCKMGINYSNPSCTFSKEKNKVTCSLPMTVTLKNN